MDAGGLDNYMCLLEPKPAQNQKCVVCACVVSGSRRRGDHAALVAHLAEAHLATSQWHAS